MLTSMREGIKNSRVLKYVLVVFICAPFAFFGINSYFGNGGSVFAVKVDGEEVSVRVYEQELNNQRNRLRQAFGGKIPAGFASDDMLRQQALESVITSQAIAQAIDDQNIVVSKETLAKVIFETEAFQVDGRFDKDRYKAQLRSSGYTPETYEYQFSRDVAQLSLRDSVMTSSFVLGNETQAANVLLSQKRKAEFITFKLQPLLEKITIEDAEVSQYFDENQESFNHPERVKIEYIEMNPELLGVEIDVTEDDALAYYTENKDSYKIAEERVASHILFLLDENASELDAAEILAKAEGVKQRLDAGESFEDLAKEFSEDPGSAENGGSLGLFGRGAMVPAFEDVAFSIDVGQVSDPVRSSFGYHLIRVDEIKAEHGKEFPVVKDEVIALLKERQANDIFFDKNEQLANATFENPDTLIPAADATGFAIQESDWIDRLSNTGIASSPKIIQAALSQDVLVNGNNSAIIELAENHAVVLRVKEQEGPRPKKLEEVSDEIRTLLRNKIAHETLNGLLETALSQYKEGTEGSVIALDLGGELTEASEYERSNSEVDGMIISQLFKMPFKISQLSNQVKIYCAFCYFPLINKFHNFFLFF